MAVEKFGAGATGKARGGAGDDMGWEGEWPNGPLLCDCSHHARFFLQMG